MKSRSKTSQEIVSITGEPSDEPNALSYDAPQKREKVDPVTGKPSDEPNAITYGAFKARMRRIKSKTTDLTREKDIPVSGKRKRDTEDSTTENTNTKRQRLSAPDKMIVMLML